MSPFHRALYDARLEASHLHHAEVHPSHLLLGLLLSHNIASVILARPLAKKGRSTAALCEETKAGLHKLKHTILVPKLDDLRFTKEAKRVSDVAQELAKSSEMKFVGCEHLLVSLLYEHGKVRRVFAKYAITLEYVQHELDMIYTF